MAFISVLIIIVSLVFAVYAIFQILAPGVFGGAGRIPTLRYLRDALFVVLAGCAILWRHLMLAAPQLWTRRAVTKAEGPGSSPDH